MKIQNLLIVLALAGTSFTQAFAQGIPYTSTASRSIGDDDSNSIPQDFRTSRKLSDDGVSRASIMDQNMLAPAASYETHLASYAGQGSCDMGGACDGSDCGGSCGGTCGIACAAPAGGCGSGLWFSAETLLWFTQNVNTPPLVTNSDFNVDPVLGVSGVQTVFGGGSGIEYGMQPGFRVSGGAYLGPDQRVGVRGRAYGLFDASEEFSQTSDGSGGADNPSIGLPFYNLFTNAEDAFLVAFQDGGGPSKAGTVRASSDLGMLGAEGSLSFLITQTGSHRMDLLAGYTYSHLRNSISVESESVDFRFPNVGLTTTTNDLFETENVFNGAHLGVLSSVVRSRVSFNTLAKVSFGNMRQSGAVRGSSILEDAVGNQTVLGAGILTQPSNIGEFARDTFAFIPELGIKLGLAARENVHLTVGYTMLMFSNVALAGEQIDSAVDPTQLVLAPAGTRPQALFRENSFWMQSVDLGMTFMY